MSVNAIVDPLRERHSYLAPHIEIKSDVGAVSIMINPQNRVYSHATLLIEHIDQDGEVHHSLFTLNGELRIPKRMPAGLISKVTNVVAEIIDITRIYGTTELKSLHFKSFADFQLDISTQPIIAFSLWKVSQIDIAKLTLSLEEKFLRPPPYSITGYGVEEGQRAYHCFTFMQEELAKIGISAGNESWFSLRGWVPVIKTFGDAHVGRIKGATCNYLGLPPHLKQVSGAKKEESRWLSSIFSERTAECASDA